MEPVASNLHIVEVYSLADVNNRPGISKTKPADSVQPAKEKPLLMLIKLKYVNNEEKTVLTNSQLMNVLYKEFYIDVWNLPKLAVDIYMNVLKRFLKTWPRWGTVDTTVRSSEVDKSIDIERVLLKEYESLKFYLKEVLEMSREPTEATMKKVNATTDGASERAVLEVTCTREQLNQLIPRYPNLTLETIFNGQLNPKPKKYTNPMELKQLCYWPGFSMEIDAVKSFQYTRKNMFNLTHTLVNHKLGPPPDPPSISHYVHARKKTDSSYQLYSSLSNFLDNLLKSLHYIIDTEKRNAAGETNANMVKVILNTVKKDLTHCPHPVDRNSEYMYFLNAHPYVRHLVQPALCSNFEQSKYDLELLEYILPNVIFNISVSPEIKPYGSLPDISVEKIVRVMLADKEHWIRFRCIYCDIVFYGLHSVRALQSHFRETHCDEQDPLCSQCGKVFSMSELARICWIHKC